MSGMVRAGIVMNIIGVVLVTSLMYLLAIHVFAIVVP